MYYSYPCSYCEKVFYTFNDSRENAASVLFYGIKQHLIDYDEDRKEYEFDDEPQVDIDKIYYTMAETNYAPSGGYELE
jgi:hypothetical protein